MLMPVSGLGYRNNDISFDYIVQLNLQIHRYRTYSRNASGIGSARMRTIPEPARAVDVILETDVLVVGSGPGGLAAALAAARAGARTALIDRNGCFGGNITQVGVEGFAWYRHEKTVDCEGIGIEFETRANAMGAAMPEPQSLSHALDAEMFKWVADVLVEEAGVKPMLHRLAVPIVRKSRWRQGALQPRVRQHAPRPRQRARRAQAPTRCWASPSRSPTRFCGLTQATANR